MIAPRFRYHLRMPRKSKKRLLEEELSDLVEERQLLALRRQTFPINEDEERDEWMDDMVDMAAVAAYNTVCNVRYVFREDKYRKPRPVFVRDMETPGPLPWLTDDEFLQKYRMRRCSFEKLLSLIERHEVFHNKSRNGRGGKPQRPVADQLMVLLNYLGTAGSGASNQRQRQMFGIGSGSSENYRKRCVKAIRSLREEVLYWPDEEERDQIAKRITTRWDIPNCVAVADGTLFPLMSEPQASDAPDYSGRKHLYSLTVMVVNDDRRKIRYYHGGFPGSAHDSRVYASTPLALEPDRFFSPVQYLIGDSAFENSPSVVASFKAPKGHALDPEHERFNRHLGRLRVLSEHTIGMLKARFPWLRCIPMVITDDPRSVEKILKYIDTCIILHNLLIDECDDDLPREWYEGWTVGEVAGDPTLEALLQQNDPKDTRRLKLLDYLRDFYFHV